MKRALCSEVPEFAAYFRRALSEVRGKTEIGRPDLCFRLPRPAVLLAKIGLCSEVFDFSPHFRNARPCKACSSNISGICDNIQLSWKHQRAVVGKPNNDPSLSPPHVESTATASLRIIFRNIQHSGFSEMRPLLCKLIPNLEAVQLAIWQIAVFL